MKFASTFFGPAVRAAVARNVARAPEARAERDRLVAEAAPWRALDEGALWARVFGATLPRSWMVWSNGHCPTCQKAVVMYEWRSDALASPWKLACPHCAERFPTNDFGAFYRSGLDPAGVFDPARADRALLFNAAHPDPADPLHRFGVDDGNGFVDGERRWRFIAAYLIYGEWKQVIVAGIRRLAAAYVATGDRAYGRRALVLLDRVADVFPSFDFATQGDVYEVGGHAGYVSVWHDANMEHADLIVAYDQVFDALRGDADLVAWLSARARTHGLANTKVTPEDIQRNIEERLFRDALANRHRIHTNFPGMHTLAITLRAVLDWPDCREEVYRYWADVLRRTTAVDGVTGEKGLPSYARVTLRWLANAASLFVLGDPEFVRTMVARVPAFARMFRFHLDTWCGDGRFYPNVGDGTYFGAGALHYIGLSEVTNDPAQFRLTKTPGARPSMDRLLFEMYRATDDVDLARVIVRENGGTVRNSVFDLTLDDAPAVEAQLQRALDEHGLALRPGCVDLQQWHLAILRSGGVGRERAVWLDYDSGGYHSHQDALNLGIVAHGLDLMPDAGYPPVQFGGWLTDKATWYYHTAAHNSVVVDGLTQRVEAHKPIAGETRFWLATPTLKVMRMAAPAVYGIREYERTVLLVDLDDDAFYVVDHFRVVGGHDHAKFVHANFGPLTTEGLALTPCEDFGHGTLLRHFARDPAPALGWSGDWAIEDRYGLLPAPADLHLRYTDFTRGAQAHTHEGWYVQGAITTSVNEQWIPRLMVRRTGPAGAELASTFVGVLEPYVGRRKILAMRRLDAGVAGPEVALEIQLADGRRDVVVLQAGEGLAEHGITVHGYGALIRYDVAGHVSRLVTIRAHHVAVGELRANFEAYNQTVELAFERRGATTRARVVSDDLTERYGVERLNLGDVNLLGQLGEA